MNTPFQNFIAVMVIFGPILLVFAWIVWYKATGRAQRRRERIREREIETQMRLGMADEARIQRVADKLTKEDQ